MRADLSHLNKDRLASGEGGGMYAIRLMKGGRTVHINDHDYCLHLWRPQNEEIPRPPQVFV